MKKIHLYFGLGGLVLFLLTGQYMSIFVDSLQYTPDMERMAWRANHLYIFYISLAHLMLGLYMRGLNTKFSKNAQRLGSLLLFAATILLTAGFFIEPATASFSRPLTFFATISALFGVLMHGFATLIDNRSEA